jgi:hypothetical protein
MFTTKLVMSVCPPPRGPRRDLRMVWYLAGSLAVHLGVWAVLASTPPEPPGVEVEPDSEGVGPLFDIVPRYLPEPPGCGLSDTFSDDWSGCVLGAPIRPSDTLRGAEPRDLNNLLYCLEGPCSVGRSGGDRAPCGVPGTRPGPTFGLEVRGPRYRFAHPDGPARPSPVTMTGAGIVISGSGYDKSIVRRYLRRHLDEIGACYDLPLHVRRDNAGDVAVTFFLTSAGAVQSSSGSGFDASIAGCVANVIKAIRFPRSFDGGGVQVRTPFHFHAPRE